jgi:hypothetical protein
MEEVAPEETTEPPMEELKGLMARSAG